MLTSATVRGLTMATICALVALQPACLGAGDDADERNSAERIPACTTDVEPELARLGVPGLSAGIVKDGRLVCTAVAGLANIEETRPVTPGTVFWWASVSKPVTATTAMSVAEQGRFKLDDDVNRYLPYQVRHPNPECAERAITFRQLLTHTSSIKENESKPAYKDAFVVGKPRQPLGDYLKSYLLSGGATYDANANFLAKCPGEGNRYSSIGFGLLGYAVEVLTRTPFDRLSKERIFTPLGMNDTSFSLAGLDQSKLAMGYQGRSPATFNAVGYQEHANYPDGSLRSSVPDLARFLIMTMQHGEYEGARVLKQATVQEMLRRQIPALDDEQGFAWYHDKQAGRKVIGHDGFDPGATSFMFFDPADDAGVLLVANGQWKDGRAEALLKKLFDESSEY